MNNKSYKCQLLGATPEWYNREKLWFVHEFEQDLTRRALSITINGERNRMLDIMRGNPTLFIDADISAIRYLPTGIAVVRRSKFISTHESNPWPSVLSKFDDLDETEMTWYRNISDEDIDTIESIDNAFSRTGVIVKAGRFAKSLGCTDAEAELFSREYDELYGESIADRYEFELVNGDDIIKYYNTDNYADRNGSPLWGSCMNNKSSIIKFYAKNSKNISMAVLKLSGRVVCRAVVWNDTTIQDWGESQYGCRGGNTLFKGMFADRQYYYDDNALSVMRKKFVEHGMAYKVDLSFGSGAMSVPVNGVRENLNSDYLLMTSEVKSVSGPVPYLDTLCIVSSKKRVANRIVEGNLKRGTSTQGQAEKLGEYVKVTVGIPDKDCKFEYRSLTSSYKILMPTGTIVYGYGNSSRLNCVQGVRDWSSYHVMAEVTTERTISVPRVSRWGDCRMQEVTINSYISQMEYDWSTNEFSVCRLYDDKSGEFKPLDEFVIMSVRTSGRTFNQRLVHNPSVARSTMEQINNQFTQVNS